MEKLFKKRLPEDVIQYCIYLSSEEVDGNVSSKDAVGNYLEKCLAFVLKETSDIIWHNDCFNLHIAVENDLHYLRGSTNFADSIDDEWLIVYLLQQLTREYPELVASVSDIDGQFLLIEAAEHIPKWLTPDSCKNRVFFSKGSLHILLKPTTPGEICYCPVTSPTIKEAVNLVSAFPHKTLASSEIISCIRNRICDYPQKSFDNTQFVNTYIPKSLALILDKNPNFISNCVLAFYLRDPFDLRACRTFKYMVPDSRVWCQIPMTRLHYAQLMQQSFSPDKRSGYQNNNDVTATVHKGVDLGIKIAHGCEIVLSKNFSKLKQDNHVYFDEQKFLHFVASLKEMDYFGEELEGSKLYQQLFNQAKMYYINTSEKDARKDLSAYNIPNNVINACNILNEIDDKNTNVDAKLQKLEIKTSLSELPPESSDRWMYLEEDDVNRLADKMNKGFSSLQKKTTLSENVELDRGSRQFKEAVKKVNNFVTKKSDFSGVETEKDHSSIKFNVDEFMSSLEQLLQTDSPQSKDSFSDLGNQESDEFLSSDDEDVSDFLDGDNAFADTEFRDYLKSMDSELSTTVVGKSFVSKHLDDNCEALLHDEEGKSRVNADVNLLENFMMGRDEERVTSGPISNILNSIGVDLPD